MISIVTLTYNRKDQLKSCLAHIQKNTRSDCEMIVVDNGSEDGTQEMVAQDFPEARLISLEGNRGGWCRNYGFAEAEGKFIGQVDSDVLVWPSWDRILLRYLEEEEIGMVGPQGWIFTNWERPNEGRKADIQENVDFLTGFCWMMRNIPDFRYDEEFGYWHEDLSFSFRVKSLGWKIRQSQPCCTHLALRGEVNWKDHDAGLQKVKEIWMQNLNLRFEAFDQKRFLEKTER